MAKYTIDFVRSVLTEYFLDSKQYDSYEDKVESIQHKESRQVIRFTAKNHGTVFNKLVLMSLMMNKDEKGRETLHEVIAGLSGMVLYEMRAEGYYK